MNLRTAFLFLVLVISQIYAQYTDDCVPVDDECSDDDNCHCCSGCSVNSICKSKDDSVCQLADALLILILEIIGIAIAICVVIGLITVGILCYCRS